MKTGLILEGGAMRGMFTAGVLDVLMEQGITVDGMVGVSAGAVFGCNYKSHQIGRTIRYNTTYCNDKRYASFRNLLRTGNLYSEDFCYHEVPEKLDPFDDKAFRESPMDYFVVCTDVRTGDPIYYKCRTGDAEDVRWMEARHPCHWPQRSSRSAITACWTAALPIPSPSASLSPSATSGTSSS